MSDQATDLRDPVRPVDMEFFCHLEVIDQTVRGMPGSFVRRQGVDPRLPNLRTQHSTAGTTGPKEQDEIALYETLAIIRHRRSGVHYIAFRETMDALLARQEDVTKYPEWLMKHPVKKTELKIHIARVLSKPTGRDDRSWISFLDESPESEKIFDTICLYLLRKQILQEEMFART